MSEGDPHFLGGGRALAGLAWRRVGRLRGSRIFHAFAVSAASEWLVIASAAVYMVVSTSVLFRYFGADEFGLWVTVLSLGGLLSVLNLGIGPASVNLAARAFASGSRNAVATVLVAVLAISLCIALAVLVLGATLLQFLDISSYIKHPDSIAAATIDRLVASFFVIFALGIPSSALSSCLQGLHAIWIANVARSAGSFVAAAAVLIATPIGVDIVTMLWITFGMQTLILACAIGVALLVRLKGSGRIQMSRVLAYTRRMWTTGAIYLVMQLIATIAILLDYILLSSLVGTAAAGQYAIVQRAFQIVVVGLGATSSQLWQVYAHLRARGEYRRAFRLARVAFVGALATSVFLGVLINAFRAPILEVWIGSAMPELAVAFALYAIYAVLDTTGSTVGTYLNATNRPHLQIVPGLVFGGLSIALKLILIPQYGINGLVFAVVCAYVVGDIILYATIYVRRETIVRRGQREAVSAT